MTFPRVKPLADAEMPPETTAGVERYRKLFGFVPNSFRTMARKPKIAKAFNELHAAVAESLTIPKHLRALMFHVMSYTAGCRYCQAHSIGTLKNNDGLPEEKLAVIWEYETHPLFTEAERTAMRFAQAAATVPNDVTEDDFVALRRHFSDDQIVEIVACLAVGAFLNRWNDTMGTELEAPARTEAEHLLGGKGWTVGKHAS